MENSRERDTSCKNKTPVCRGQASGTAARAIVLSAGSISSIDSTAIDVLGEMIGSWRLRGVVFYVAQAPLAASKCIDPRFVAATKYLVSVVSDLATMERCSRRAYVDRRKSFELSRSPTRLETRLSHSQIDSLVAGLWPAEGLNRERALPQARARPQVLHRRRGVGRQQRPTTVSI